jgi:hypothetical protein
MSATASMVRDHQTIFRGLEILRLMSERMEERDEVDRDDIRIVLGFMQDITQRCLDNTQELLRQTSKPEILEAFLPHHGQAKELLAQMSGMAEPAAHHFAPVSRSYMTVIGKIFREPRFFPSLVQCDPPTRARFQKMGQELRDMAKPQNQMLRRLEAKYISAYCI